MKQQKPLPITPGLKSSDELLASLRRYAGGLVHNTKRLRDLEKQVQNLQKTCDTLTRDLLLAVLRESEAE